MVKKIKSMLQKNKEVRLGAEKSRLKFLISIMFVLFITFGVFLFERGYIHTPQNITTSESAKIAKTIESKIEESSSSEAFESSRYSEEVQEESVIRPMTVERQDNDDSYTKLGRVIINKEGINIDLEIIKGAGSNEQSTYDKLFYACTDKMDQILGKDNFILATHSSSIDEGVGFTKILRYDSDGLSDPKRGLDVSQLTLKEGDLITIYQNSDQKYYTFSIIFIQGDDTENHSVLTEKMADTGGKPQLTLYACTKVGNNEDGRIIVQADLISISSTN